MDQYGLQMMKFVRSTVGGQFEIKMQLRNPVVTKQIEKVEEKWLLVSL